MSAKKQTKTLILLHLMLMVYSFSGIFSKLASGEQFLSFKFCLFYCGVIGLLGFYAIAWQQIIKRLPLTFAYANRAVTVIWGCVWGMLIFHESISLQNVAGMALIIAGIVLFTYSDKEKPEDTEHE